MMSKNQRPALQPDREQPDDISALRDAFSLTAFRYIDIARQERLAAIHARWPGHLTARGESSVAVDFSPHNQLCSHFNASLTHARGWAHSALHQQRWQQSAMHYTAQLDFIPFGQLPRAEALDYLRQPETLLTPWAQQLASLRAGYHWVLLDIPADMPQISQLLLPHVDHHLTVLTPDANCHLRLHQAMFPANTRFLSTSFPR